jgi:hypothetical protein
VAQLPGLLRTTIQSNPTPKTFPNNRLWRSKNL